MARVFTVLILVARWRCMLPREISLSGALFSTYLWFPPSLIRPFFVRAFAVYSVLHRSQKGNNFFLSLPEACANFFVIAQYLCHHSVSIDRCKYIPSLIKFFLVQLHYRELKLSHVCFIITYSILVSFPFFLHLVTSDGEDETLWSSVQVQHPRFARGAPRVWPGWGAGLSLDLNRGLSNSPQRSSGWDVALRHRRDAAFTGERPLWTAFSSAESCWSMSWPSRHCLHDRHPPFTDRDLLEIYLRHGLTLRVLLHRKSTPTAHAISASYFQDIFQMKIIPRVGIVLISSPPWVQLSTQPLRRVSSSAAGEALRSGGVRFRRTTVSNSTDTFITGKITS